MRYRMIEELSKTHAVRDLCQLLGVTRSGYYAWCRGSETSRKANNRKLAEEIKELFEAKGGPVRQSTDHRGTAPQGAQVQPQTGGAFDAPGAAQRADLPA